MKLELIPDVVLPSFAELCNDNHAVKSIVDIVVDLVYGKTEGVGTLGTNMNAKQVYAVRGWYYVEYFIDAIFGHFQGAETVRWCVDFAGVDLIEDGVQPLLIVTDILAERNLVQRDRLMPRIIEQIKMRCPQVEPDQATANRLINKDRKGFLARLKSGGFAGPAQEYEALHNIVPPSKHLH